MTPIVVGKPERLHFDADAELGSMYLLSPYVWRAGASWHVAVRAVPDEPRAADKIARIHVGTSSDGVSFALDKQALLVPGPAEDDLDGCEDPTVVQIAGNGLHIFYSGWNEKRKVGQLLAATADGRVVDAKKTGSVFTTPNRFANAKEASVVAVRDDDIGLFIEYSKNGASAVGLANATSLQGPWLPTNDPFVSRPQSWDDTHLSPGPVARANDDTRVLFYNGADSQTHWRIGWVQLDATGKSIVARSQKPLISPPPVSGDDTDIAFCSSFVQEGNGGWLYYTVSDKEAFRSRIMFD